MNASVDKAAVAHPPFAAERFLIYVMSFAGLMAVIFAAAGWLQLLGALGLNALGIDSGLTGSQIRVQASYDLASAVVGLIVWLAFWRLATRRITRNPIERQSLERRIFLAGIFAVTSVVVLFFLEQFIRAGFATVAGGSFRSHLHDLLAPLTFILAYGATWIWHARIGWRERYFKAPDAPHDFAIYCLLSFALGFLFYGIQSAIGTAVADISGQGQTWTGWIEPASFILSGSAVWAVASAYDQARRGRRFLRVVFLYIMLAFAVGISLTEGIMVGSALLEHAFDSSTDLTFVWNQVQYLVPATAMWVFYWTIVRSQASLVPAGRPGAIPWPRRPAMAAFCLIGLLMATSAILQLAWTGLEALLSPPTYHLWWATNLSHGTCELAAGGVLWALSWKLLQHAAKQNPKEIVAWERRWLLFAITTLSALGALSGIIATVFVGISRVLNTSIGGNFVLHEAEALVGVLLAGVILTYYGRIFLTERRDRTSVPSQLRVSALITPGSEPAIARLRQVDGVLIDVVGYVASAPNSAIDSPPGQLQDRSKPQSLLSANHEGARIDSILQQLDHLRSQGTDRAWLVLTQPGATLYPYTRTTPPVPSPTPDNPMRNPLAGTA